MVKLNLYDNASCLSKLFMYWLFPTVRRLSKTNLNSNKDLETLPKALDVDSNFQKLSHAWMCELNTKNPNFLKALFRAFGWSYFEAGVPYL